MGMLEIVIEGVPMTQGSKTAVAKGVLIEGRSKTGRAKFAAWRQAVTLQARAAHRGEPLDGPLGVELEVRLPLIKTAPKRRRIWPYKGLDIDKLTRAVFDGLSDAGVWVNDNRPCDVRVTKRYDYDEPAGCTVRIWQLEEEAA